MKKLLFYILAIILLSSCETINDNRIPPTAVNIELNNQGLWDTYGVHGYGQYRTFIKSERVPSNYPYTELTYTGFGGVLLISGALNGNYNVPLAYDLACPIEAKYNVRITIDNSNFQAYCSKCGSRYDVCEGSGRPVSGEALTKNYGLKCYNVIPSSLGGYTIMPKN